MSPPNEKRVGVPGYTMSQELNLLPTEQILTDQQFEMQVRQREPKVLNSARLVETNGVFYSGSINAWLEGNREMINDRILREWRRRMSEPTIFLVAIGEPGSGKTTILNDIAENIIYGSNTEDQHGIADTKEVKNHDKWQIRASTADWGRSFVDLDNRYYEHKSGLWLPARVPEWVNYHDNNSLTWQERQRLGIGEVDLGEWKRRELMLAAKAWRLTLRETAARYYYQKNKYPELYTRKKIGQIVLCDHPGPTGIGEEGFDRANQVLQDMIHHTGDFEGLHYECVLMGVTALPEVLLHNRSQRPVDRNHAEAVDPLNRDMMIAHSEEEARLAEEHYIQEAASRSEIEKFDRDMENYWRIRAVQLEQSGVPSLAGLGTVEEMTRNYETRQWLIGTIFLPDFFQNILGITNPETVPIFQNCQVQSEVTHSTLALHRPAEDLSQAGAFELHMPELRRSA